MSTLFIGDLHLDALLTYMIDNQIHTHFNGSLPATKPQLQIIGANMRENNLRAYLNACKQSNLYLEKIGQPGQIRPIPEMTNDYRFSYCKILYSDIEMIKACHALATNSNAWPPYKKSIARAAIKAILFHAITNLSGYDDAAWHIE